MSSGLTEPWRLLQKQAFCAAGTQRDKNKERLSRCEYARGKPLFWFMAVSAAKAGRSLNG